MIKITTTVRTVASIRERRVGLAINFDSRASNNSRIGVGTRIDEVHRARGILERSRQFCVLSTIANGDRTTWWRAQSERAKCGRQDGSCEKREAEHGWRVGRRVGASERRGITPSISPKFLYLFLLLLHETCIVTGAHVCVGEGGSEGNIWRAGR
jgi:hypothetical protein